MRDEIAPGDASAPTGESAGPVMIGPVGEGLASPVEPSGPRASPPGPWIVVGASVAGARHAMRGQVCEDAHGHATMPDGALVVAVADGAGSASRAVDGARSAVDAALAALADRWTGGEAPGFQLPRAGVDAVRNAFAAARTALERLAEAESVDLRELACTLTCIVAADGETAAGQVGDGIAVAHCEDGSIVALTRPQRGEYANEASFLTSPDALDQLEVRELRAPVDAVAVVTDGLLRLAADMPGGTPHGPFFAPLWRFAAREGRSETASRQLADFLGSDRVNARTDDDKTLVLAVRAADTEAAGAADGGAGGAADRDPAGARTAPTGGGAAPPGGTSAPPGHTAAGAVEAGSADT